ncbi:hypothetical protein CALCODRAFT_484732 [Calocera cornea HHB12733]|uniref:Acyl-CoA N-acyltransferase n=1 Tax=Calocera cornea HHB12733 TaxID=1353952 RepID=A0A165EST0_9BASI|nr:hypothetical protein CALCODRAFT_484732 [Calocera cornea HHB12733]
MTVSTALHGRGPLWYRGLCARGVESHDTTLPGRTFSTLPRYAPSNVESVLTKRLFAEDGSVTTFVALHPDTKELLGYVEVKEHAGPFPEGYQSTAPEVQLPESPPEIHHLFTKVPRDGGNGKGVGSTLIQRVLAEERWASVGILVGCFERNRRAQAFYQKWGWRQVGKVEVEVGEGDKEIAHLLWLKGTHT